MMKEAYNFKIILKYVTLVLLILLPFDFVTAEDKNKASKPDFEIYLYANNTIYVMNSDGSKRKKLFEKADIIEFFSLPDERILVHSKQYDGHSLEIYDASSGIWSLVEFTEGEIPNIAISEDGKTIAYEIRHFPISISGDGVWLYDVTGKKSHAKVANTALTIESFVIFSDRLFLLYHELDLISDEAGLFLEIVPLNTANKPRRTRIPEGTKLLFPQGYSVGFVYPTSGKKLQLSHLLEDITFSTLMPSGDIILHENCLHVNDKSLLVFGRKAIDFSGKEYEEILIWDTVKNKLTPLKIPENIKAEHFKFAPDGSLYFVGRYFDLSGEQSSPMLFRINLTDNKTEIISINVQTFNFKG